ncbi:hypothetical protein Kuura_023 [Caulobacter phage Kuura]|nr:hypothetical protein Kuura_023 [Caulobacter phage Kuura]
MSAEGNGLAWGAKVSEKFRDFVRQMEVDFRVDPNWFMACMAFETMETFRPDIRPMRDGKRLSSAVGLIQFLDATAEELGTTTTALAAMTAEEQLPWVWKYFRNRIRAKGPLQTLEDVYMAIHWPAAIGKPLDEAMYVKGTSAYAVNASLDLNKDHTITKREAGELVRLKLAKGLEAQNRG